MRVGLLSDIHGNSRALEAVLEHGRTQGVDRWLNLGDIFYGPLEPMATYRLLQPLEIPTIQGNQDRDLYDATPEQIARNRTLRYDLEDLGLEPVAWLRSLPKTLEIDGVFACHGTPADDLVYLLEDVSSGHPHVREGDEILRLLGDVRATLIVCGHTHIARTVRLPTGQLVVNPGSVGLPAYDDDSPNYHRMQTYAPEASYAIVERSNEGWSVRHSRVPYDHAAAAAQALRLGRGDWAEWLGTGRASEAHA